MLSDTKTNTRPVVLFWLVLVATVGIALYLFWLNHGGQVERSQAPAGQSLYVFSKLMGIVALVLLWWQVVIALLGRSGVIPSMLMPGRWLHISLGTILTFCIFLHVGTFIAAVSNRVGELSLGSLLPTFTQGYYETARSLGIIALLLIVGAIAMSTYGRRYVRLWRSWHMLVILALALVLVHAYLIGSEIRSPLFQPLFWGLAVTFALAVLTRWVLFART